MAGSVQSEPLLIVGEPPLVGEPPPLVGEPPPVGEPPFHGPPVCSVEPLSHQLSPGHQSCSVIVRV